MRELENMETWSGEMMVLPSLNLCQFLAVPLRDITINFWQGRPPQCSGGHSGGMPTLAMPFSIP